MPVIAVDIHKAGSEQKSSLIEKLTETAVSVTKVPERSMLTAGVPMRRA